MNNRRRFLDIERHQTRTQNWIRAILSIMFLIIVISFRKELGIIISGIVQILRSSLSFLGTSSLDLSNSIFAFSHSLKFSSAPTAHLAAGQVFTPFSISTIFKIAHFFQNIQQEIPEGFQDAVIVILFNLIVFILAFLFMARLVAGQALLPVSTRREIWQTITNLIFTLFRLNGPAIFVENGETNATPEDQEHEGLGVVMVDFNSAIVLEESRRQRFSMKSLKDKLNWFISYSFLVPGYFVSRFQSPRIAGAGITFTRPWERLRSVVDLRRQSRSRMNVSGYTRDGIELEGLIFCLFTLGEDPEPDALNVAYIGEPSAENLRVLNINYDQNNPDRVTINGFSNDLDEADRNEIHQNALTFLSERETRDQLSLYENLPPRSNIPIFNENRVFSAVFSQARGKENENELLPWEDLPIQISVDNFREILSEYNFDQLFDPHPESITHIRELNNRIRLSFRNNGILSYRLIFRSGNRPISAGSFNRNNILHSQVIPLTNNKVLRDRGIRAIACGCPFMHPVEKVFDQKLDNWRARWQKDRYVAEASNELNVLRIRNRARREAQQEMRFNLEEILKSTEHPDQVLAIRILDALEEVALNPATKNMLNSQTIYMMSALRDNLLKSPPGRK